MNKPKAPLGVGGVNKLIKHICKTSEDLKPSDVFIYIYVIARYEAILQNVYAKNLFNALRLLRTSQLRFLGNYEKAT